MISIQQRPKQRALSAANSSVQLLDGAPDFCFSSSLLALLRTWHRILAYLAGKNGIRSNGMDNLEENK
jgi:hypothetical protein